MSVTLHARVKLTLAYCTILLAKVSLATPIWVFSRPNFGLEGFHIRDDIPGDGKEFLRKVLSEAASVG